jgi:hypothetical protein
MTVQKISFHQFTTEYTIMGLFKNDPYFIMLSRTYGYSKRSVSKNYSITYILILSPYLRPCLLSGIFPSGFYTRAAYEFLFSFIHASSNINPSLPILSF